MTYRRWLLALSVGLVVVGTAAVATGKTTRETPPAGGSSIDGVVVAATDGGVDVERVVLEVTLLADGSARWTVEHRVRLDEPEVTRGFERARERLRRNRSAFREPFVRRVRTMATEAEEATGRTMVVENVSVEAYRTQLQGEYGVIEYRFRWHGFATTGDRLQAGDALSGLFLDEETTLLVTWPAEATLTEVTPEPDERRERAVVWEGPVEFVRGEPRVVVESSSLTFAEPAVPGGSDDIFLTLLVLTAVVGTAGVAVVAARRRLSGEDAERTEPVESTGEEAGSAGTRSEDAESTADSSEDEPPGTPAELLSNEEQVLALLDDRGGRVKQQEVVTELEWSETKTSEVVSELREAGEIEVYRLGRENVLALPDTGLGIDTGGDEE